MHAQPLIGALARRPFADLNVPSNDDAIGSRSAADPTIDRVVTAAVLVNSAFRLRDETGLVATLRELSRAVADMEAAGAA